MTPKKGNDKVDRRDFINGMLIAAGAAAVGGPLPMRAYDGGTTFPCDGPIGNDPRALRGGNVPSVFNIAHWLRDKRLTFKTNSVLISSSHCDSYQGSQPILADNGNYEVIIVGAGMSGCSAAYYITRQRPGTEILILDGQRTPGGNANRDDAAPIPDIASTATACAVQPYAPFLDDIYNTTGILWQNYLVPSPFYSYYFDDMTPYVNAGTHSWNLDTCGKGLDGVPYPVNIVNDLKAARADLMNWYHKPGAPTDPADNSDPKYDYLSPMTFDSYLTETKGFHPAVSDFYTRYAVGRSRRKNQPGQRLHVHQFSGSGIFPRVCIPGRKLGNAEAHRQVADSRSDQRNERRRTAG